jgi:hypothetical protein
MVGGGYIACQTPDINKADFTTLNEVNKVISNPFSSVKTIGKNLFFNGRQINSEIDAAIASVEAKDYVNFGRNMAKVLIDATVQKKEEQLFLS